MKQNIHNHHLEKLDQMVCIVPAGVGSNLGAVVAVVNQKGQNSDLFSYMRPQIHSVSCSDCCGESSCGGLALRLAFVYTSSPCEGDIANQRRLYIRGNHFGPAFPVLGRQNSQRSQTKSRVCGLPDSAQPSWSNCLKVQYACNSAASCQTSAQFDCTEPQLLAGGTLITCKVPARPPGTVGCAVEFITVTVMGQTSAEFSS